MTNAHHAADAHTMVECPKCAGTGHTHRQWAHIVGGDCFLCGAAGQRHQGRRRSVVGWTG